MTGTITDLKVAATLAGRHLLRKLKGQQSPAHDLSAFQSEVDALIAQIDNSHLKAAQWVTLSATQAPWFGSGITLEAGEEITVFAEGRVYANKALDIWLEPTMQLWFKLGDDGDIFRGTRQSHSFSANKSAELLLGNYFPNDWQDLQGQRQQDDKIYQSNSGETRILIIRWQGKAVEGLEALLAKGDSDGRIANELQRLSAAPTAPTGWHYLWNLGPAEIYQQQDNSEHGTCIRCHTHKNVGILQYPLDIALDEHCEISWQWLLQQLPATLREDSLPSHDYLSLAVEFDNGRDISYYWSNNLAEGYGFDCPLPNWQGKEYHVVVRSGQQGLGQWLGERRNLYSDYQHYMGTPPKRIVAVWLIANSIFMRGHGICEYADIVLHHNNQQTRVL